MVVDPPECVLADEVGLHVEVDEPAEPELVGVGVDVGIGVIGEHPALDPSNR